MKSCDLSVIFPTRGGSGGAEPPLKWSKPTNYRKNEHQAVYDDWYWVLDGHFWWMQLFFASFELKTWELDNSITLIPKMQFSQSNSQPLPRYGVRKIWRRLDRVVCGQLLFEFLIQNSRLL